MRARHYSRDYLDYKRLTKKKRKRPRTVQNFGNEKVVSTISALRIRHIDEYGDGTPICRYLLDRWKRDGVN